MDECESKKNKELGNQQPSSEQEKAQRLSEKSRDKCLEMGGPVKGEDIVFSYVKA